MWVVWFLNHKQYHYVLVSYHYNLPTDRSTFLCVIYAYRLTKCSSELKLLLQSEKCPQPQHLEGRTQLCLPVPHSMLDSGPYFLFKRPRLIKVITLVLLGLSIKSQSQKENPTVTVAADSITISLFNISSTVASSWMDGYFPSLHWLAGLLLKPHYARIELPLKLRSVVHFYTTVVNAEHTLRPPNGL